ncbi:MAG: hypothetical protein KAR03_11290 [Candidatus Thorarchaeota archaeon]|nr:hypothetical protein [Candidatus Thorarchaeota archaeon]
MYSKSNKMLLVAVALIIVVGTGFIFFRGQTGIEVITRPETHLEPYGQDTTNLSLVIVGENIEIRVDSFFMSTMDPHNGPTTMGCSVTLDVINTSNETINDFTGEMGTVFDEDNEAIYSFWIDMRVDNIPVGRISLPAFSSTTVRCHDLGSFIVPSEDYSSYDLGYVRVKVRYNSNFTATITTALGDILHAIE